VNGERERVHAQLTTESLAGPGTTLDLDAEVVEFRPRFGQTSLRDELARRGARLCGTTRTRSRIGFARALRSCRRTWKKRYAHLWADGVHVNVRLENETKQRQCRLVLMGATADGKKKLLAVVDSYRERVQGWYQLLIDLKQRSLVLTASGVTLPDKISARNY